VLNSWQLLSSLNMWTVNNVNNVCTFIDICAKFNILKKIYSKHITLTNHHLIWTEWQFFHQHITNFFSHIRRPFFHRASLIKIGAAVTQTEFSLSIMKMKYTQWKKLKSFMTFCKKEMSKQRIFNNTFVNIFPPKKTRKIY
jgi:hypothetical protein